MISGADDKVLHASPTWQALATGAGQVWLAPLIVGTAWWNALLGPWLVLNSGQLLRRETHHLLPPSNP